MFTLTLEMDRAEVEWVLLALAVRKSNLDKDVETFEAMRTVNFASAYAADCRLKSDQVWSVYLKVARALDHAVFAEGSHES